MKKFLRWHSAITMLFLFLTFASGAVWAQVRSSTVFGVTTGNQLVRFNTRTPNSLTTIGPITGLQAGENILGIDFRPATGELFALGSTNRLYIINTLTGAATSAGVLSTALTGTSFGFDFNPTVDRIRIVSNTGQNLRVNPADGSTTVDGGLNGAATSAESSGYTNSFGGSTSTTLFTISSTSDTLFIQNPPNNGTLVTVGALGVNVTDVNGFDILSANNTAFAVFTVGTTTSLFSINLTSGAATLAGNIGTGAVSLRGIAIVSGGAAGASTVTVDFDGDSRTDYSVFRPDNNTWFINRSSNNSFLAVTFGLAASDILTPGDYDGDGRTDIAVWRSTNGVFFVLRSSDGVVSAVQFGSPGDQPIARDYDGDGRTDYAVARNSGGSKIFYILNSSNGSFRAEQFGLSSDVVTPGDYDGDGRFDIAVRRGSGTAQATFFVQRSTAGFTAVQFGLGGDLVVPGDYDGDGRTDFAVVRQGTPYTWFILRSSDNGFQAVQFGSKPQFTTQGDYDGDGRTDISTFNPITGNFFVLRSTNSQTISFRFGQNGDYPVANFDTH